MSFESRLIFFFLNVLLNNLNFSLARNFGNLMEEYWFFITDVLNMIKHLNIFVFSVFGFGRGNISWVVRSLPVNLQNYWGQFFYVGRGFEFINKVIHNNPGVYKVATNLISFLTLSFFNVIGLDGCPRDKNRQQPESPDRQQRQRRGQLHEGGSLTKALATKRAFTQVDFFLWLLNAEASLEFTYFPLPSTHLSSFIYNLCDLYN